MLAVAGTNRRRQDEPQTLHVAPQFDGGADDGTARRVRAVMRVVVADAHEVFLPGDDEGLGWLHRGERIGSPA